MDFRTRLWRFFSGRYGADETFFLLFGVAALLAFVNCFLRCWPLQLVVYALGLLALLRAFSRNYEARRRENTVARKAMAALQKHIDTKRRQRADCSHIYKKCPHCKAVLRLPRRKGRHKTVCPRCDRAFSVWVWRE